MNPDKDKPENEPMKVTDRRKFDEKGDLKADANEAAEPEAAAAAGSDTEETQEDTAQKDDPGETRAETAQTALPMNFAAFLLSLGSMAMIYMGEAPNPETKKVEKHLGLAKQHIDILGMLKDKTKGNLTHEEEKLLENLLYELRMKYVELST